MDDKVGGKLAGPPGSKGGNGPYGVQLVPGYEPIPQGWTRGPVPFGTFIDRQDDGREILSPALGAADRREGRAARPRDLPRLEKRADGGWRGSAGKSTKSCPWAAAAPCGRTGWGDRLPQKGLEHPRAPQTRRRQCPRAMEAVHLPGGDGPRAASGVRAGIAALRSALARPVGILGPGWAHQRRMDIAVAWQVP